MPSPKNDSFDRILRDVLTPDFQGIIWITSRPLSSRPHPFNAMDYFFDGVLGKSLNQSPAPSRQNIFFSHSFGQPFFLAHIVENVDKKHFTSIFNAIRGIKREKDKILVLEESHSDKIEQFKKISPSPIPEFIFMRIHR